MEETTQPVVGVQTETQPDASQQPEVVEPEVKPTITVKYNKKEKELSLEEAREYAEKGMNYDKLKERVQGYENDEGVKWLQSVAKQYGVSTADLIKKHGGELEKSIVKEYAEANDLPEDKAKKELQGNAEYQQLKQELDELKSSLENEKRINAEIDSVKDAGYKLDDVTDEILAVAAQRKIPLVIALELAQAQTARARIAELEKQLGVQKVNDANAESSMGKIDGAEFEGELTEEVIKNMTRAQRQNPATMKKILEWMGGKKK